MPRYGAKKFSPETYPVQMTVSFPRVIKDMILDEAERLGISKTEFVRQCVIAYAINHEPYKNKLNDAILKSYRINERK